MSRFWSKIVHDLDPYVPGEQPRIEGLIKLNTNENPYPPSPKALEAIRRATDEPLRLYPDPVSAELRETIAASFGLEAGNIFVGNGSDEVLAHAFMGLLKQDGPLLFPDITYSFYPVYCGLYGIEAKKIPLADDMSVDIDAYRGPAGAIILPNPNAPTGIALPLADIRKLAEADRDRLLVVDEAYVDFGGESAAALVPDFDNILVIRTFSKSYSLAGSRVGFAIGQRPLIEALERVKDSFNSYPLDRLAQAAATAAWKDRDWFEATRSRIMMSRNRLAGDLTELGFEVLPSAANFVFARHAGHEGASLAAALRAEAILVRHFNKPRISDYLRITVGTEAECSRLVEVLRKIL
ncbi:histidinol-phosphate transaminase [Pseudohoeflea suaedae]|uniref:Histidinol-phosphate aminotransferase n=1 Tax=Pseudohoeflea suaedae TaxID=877384 RepID=A0A4R5PKX0_9HYPH|nr:histidinol-phosphate transaminase [Pseudohoeflea suaedae]TDH35968.1 histidinol-phosphate transaminase [Pseudohoeflea suaedae]